MMRVLHFIWAIVALLPVQAAAQAPAASPSTTGYTIFVRGTPIGREDVTLRQDETGLTITSTGRLGQPVNMVLRRAEVKYGPDWSAEYVAINADVQGAETDFTTRFSDITQLAQGVIRGQTINHTDVGSLRPFVLPNLFFGAYEAIARRLGATDTGTEHRAYVAPQAGEAAFQLAAVSTERMQTGTTTFEVRRYVLQFQSAGPAPFLVNLYSDTNGRLVRLNVPAQGLDVVRDDLASSTARMLVYSNPGDEAVFIPASGFNLGATITRPPADVAPPANGRYPAVVLIGGAAITDRDGVVAGVPILGQIAGALAEAGFIAVRYDRRGYGQSGGRSESATMDDFADDARQIVRWLAQRRDVDRDRIAVLGHAEGAWIAMLTAAREGRVRAVVSIAAPSVTGEQLVLEQQQLALERLNAPPAEREEKIALQQRINAAVLSGTGWDGIDPAMRAQADTPWFQSLLRFDPARVLRNVNEPILFVHGQLDREIPVAHVDRIAEIARARSRAVAIVSVRGVNHLMAPAETGDVAEYATLQDRNVSADVTKAITDWLIATLPSR